MKVLILKIGWIVIWAMSATTLMAESTGSLIRDAQVLKNTSVSGYLAEMKSERLSQIMNRSENKSESFDIRTGKRQKTSKINSKRKNPAKAFFYSALIPGGGQLYNGSKWKALVFVGIEVMAWSGHISYNSKGDSRTDQFNDFADTHWSQADYENYLWVNWGFRDDDSIFDGQGFSLFTHHLPSTKTQQYYEMIGKYNQFIYGWDDMSPMTTDTAAHNYATSVNRQFYEEMRHDANNYFDNAKTSLIVVMFNHIISGTEAALAARSQNRSARSLAQRLSFKAYSARNEYESFPMISMTYRF